MQTAPSKMSAGEGEAATSQEAAGGGVRRAAAGSALERETVKMEILTEIPAFRAFARGREPATELSRTAERDPPEAAATANPEQSGGDTNQERTPSATSK